MQEPRDAENSNLFYEYVHRELMAFDEIGSGLFFSSRNWSS
jgi:hypothetical protein